MRLSLRTHTIQIPQVRISILKALSISLVHRTSSARNPRPSKHGRTIQLLRPPGRSWAHPTRVSPRQRRGRSVPDLVPSCLRRRRCQMNNGKSGKDTKAPLPVGGWTKSCMTSAGRFQSIEASSLAPARAAVESLVKKSPAPATQHWQLGLLALCKTSAMEQICAVAFHNQCSERRAGNHKNTCRKSVARVRVHPP